MFKFLKKKNKDERKIFYNINGEIYQLFTFEFPKEDENLSNKELLNKYKFTVRKFSKTFECWGLEKTLNSLQDFYNIYCLSENDVIEIDEKDLENTIANVISEYKSELKMKFDEIKVDDTIYTYKTYNYNVSNLRHIAIIRKKIIDESSNHIGDSLFLEIETYNLNELLNKKTTDSNRKIITFYNFMEEYEIGCKYKIVESNDGMTSIEDYLKSNEIK